MLGVFLLHGTVTPHNTGDFLMQKTMELVVIIDRDTMAKGLLGILGLDSGDVGG
jgi:hypothetical protein